MRNPVLVVDYYSELQAIHKARPELKGAPVIFTTLQFVPEELAMVEGRSACFFDTYITLADAENITARVHESMWNWFLDKEGNDLSLIDGCSLGLVSVPALEYLFTAVLRYKVGLEKILKPEHVVFCMSNTEDTSLAALRDLQASIGFTLHVIEAVGASDRPLHDAPFWRKHDLVESFPGNSWKERFVAAYLRWFQRPQRRSTRKRVLLSPGGKLDSYLDFVKRTKDSPMEFALPLVKKDLWHLLSPSRRGIYYYYFYSSRKRDDPHISFLIKVLRRNLRERIHWIDPDILFYLMERYVLFHFSRAFSHYQTVRDWLAYLKPDLVFITSDTPTQNLLGLAARVSNIPTVFCNHCLFMWGHAKTKSGPFRIVDYALAFGAKDRVDYQSMGLTEEHILTAPLPYFSRFLPLPKKRNAKYKKALLLLHQYAHFSPGAKVEQVLRGFWDPIDVLSQMGIEIIGIKIGYENNLQTLGLKGMSHFEYQGQRIPILAGQSSFSSIASKADLIVGSVSTSIVEAGLLGVDYYLYNPPAPECATPSLCPALESIIQIARTPEELYQNICGRRPYHDGHSVADLVDLSAFRSEARLCENFSAVLARIVDHASSSKRHEGVDVSRIL